MICGFDEGANSASLAAGTSLQISEVACRVQTELALFEEKDATNMSQESSHLCFYCRLGHLFPGVVIHCRLVAAAFLMLRSCARLGRVPIACMESTQIKVGQLAVRLNPRTRSPCEETLQPLARRCTGNGTENPRG